MRQHRFTLPIHRSRQHAERVYSTDVLDLWSFGKKKKWETALLRFFWYRVRDAVNQFVKQCDNCGENKAVTKTPRAPLGKMPAVALMDRLSTDISGPLPTTAPGNRYILVVTDYFTNWVKILAVPDQTAETTAEPILIGRFGCLLDIHSDQGSNYRSDSIRLLWNQRWYFDLDKFFFVKLYTAGCP